MRNLKSSFSEIVDAIYNLPFGDRVELKTLLEHNIADSRREEIIANFKSSEIEHKKGKLVFSSDIKKLKKML